MSILKKMGTAIKSASDKMANDMREQQERRRRKAAILDRFDMPNLKRICTNYGIGEPSKYEQDPFFGTKTKRTVTRAHYTSYVMENLKLAQITAYCEKHRIRISDILEEPESAPQAAKQASNMTPNLAKPAAAPQPGLPTELAAPAEPSLEAVLADIQANFEPSDTRDEKEFQNMLAVYLKAKYGKNMDREVPSAQGKIDFVLFRKFGLELKIGEKPQVLRNLIGQVVSYKKVYSELGVIVLDVGMIERTQLEEFLADYTSFGAKAITVEGALRRKKRGGIRVQVDR